MTTVDSAARVPLRLLATPDLIVATIPVGLTSSAFPTDNASLTLTVAAGDLLEVDCWAQVSTTPMVSPRYTTGVGYHIWAQRTALPLTRLRISPYCGLNVLEPTPHGHYEQLVNSACWVVPEDWAGSVDIVTVLAAASTAARTPPDVLEVRQGYAHLKVKVWR